MTKLARNLAFSLTVLVLVYVAVEGVLLVAGVTPLSERTDPYVGFAGYAPLFVEGTTPDGTRIFRTADTKIDWFNRQEFPARKGTDVTRVFCLGGSTTYGRPYDDTTSFCGWLREFLEAADPSTRWQVVNAGGISYASYRIVRLMEELVQYEPDLFIIYTGHNEFLEQRTYGRLSRTPEFLRDMGSLASHLRLYSLISDVVYPTPDVLDAEIDEVLNHSIGPETYHRDDAMRDATLEHFRISLDRMARIARDAGVDLIFVTPSSNIRDFSPFKAEPNADLDAGSLQEIERLKESITEHLDSQEYEQAAALADRALAIDSRDAELLFLAGRALLARGDTGEARRALIAARDEDVAPLRALSPTADAIAEVASANSIGLVDFEAMMERLSPDGIPGDGHFLDHVHPSIDAHRVLALAILDQIVEMEIASPVSTWDDTVVSNITQRVIGSVDETDRAWALASVARVLSWAGKQAEALRLAKRATEMTGDHHTLYEMLTVLVRNERHEEALDYARQAARLMPDIAFVRKMNGIILSENGHSAEALQELEIAYRLDPTMTDIHYHFGVVLADLGQMDRAERAYRTAIELEPRNADALNNLGILFARRGEYAEAIDWFERAVDVDPGHQDAMRNLERARGLLDR
jgi:Flp pilus assembly protein TadD/lysophospholipase L1-like esterase